MVDGTRPGLLVAALVLIVSVCPLAAAAAPTASAMPGAVRPGDGVTLTFSADDPSLAGVVGASVGERIECSLVPPEGAASTPCEETRPVVQAQVGPSRTTYTFTLAAPRATGLYTVRFTRTASLGLPGEAAVADTAFLVSPDAPPAAEPLTNLTLPDTADGPEAHAQGGAAVPDPAAGARVGVATLAASGTILVLLVATRSGGLP